MSKQLLLGDEAIAQAALEQGLPMQPALQCQLLIFS